jgi:3-oxoacyl-[acyl-carrier-protein] synthase-3
MSKAFIKSISFYLPEENRTNEQLSQQFPEWDGSKILNKTGINNRHVSGSNEFVSDMAVKAAEKVFLETKYDRKKIDFVLVCTQSPDYFLPTTACMVQDRLNLSTSCGAFDMNLGCSGFIYGLAVSKGLIAAGIANEILLIMSETYTKHIHEQDKGNLSIFGDAASATIVSSSYGKFELGEFILGTDGAGAENLIVRNGAMKFPKSETMGILDEFGAIKDNNHLFMDGREIFSFTLKAVPTLINELLIKTSRGMDEYGLFIFHQANMFMLDHLRRKIGIPESKFYLALEDCGNTVSSTIPIALKKAVDDDSIKPGTRIVLAGFGVGYSWGACDIVECSDYKS